MLRPLMRDAEPAEAYLKSFHWNKVKYRADKPLGEIVDTLQKVRLCLVDGLHLPIHLTRPAKEISSIDDDVKNKYNQYNQVKTTLSTLQRKQTYGYSVLKILRAPPCLP